MLKFGAFAIYLSDLNADEFLNLENAVKAERKQRTGMAELDITEKCLVRCGQHIGAIKMYRDRTGSGLRESKDACDAFRRTIGGYSEGMCYNETRHCWEWPTGR